MVDQYVAQLAQVELSAAERLQDSLDPCPRHVRGSLFLARERQQLLPWPAVTDDGSVLNEEGTDGSGHTEGTPTDGSRHRSTAWGTAWGNACPSPTLPLPLSHLQDLSRAEVREKKKETS